MSSSPNLSRFILNTADQEGRVYLICQDCGHVIFEDFDISVSKAVDLSSKHFEYNHS